MKLLSRLPLVTAMVTAMATAMVMVEAMVTVGVMVTVMDTDTDTATPIEHVLNILYKLQLQRYLRINMPVVQLCKINTNWSCEESF
jgi:hypothetical protein